MMKKIKLILQTALIAFGAMTLWRVGACEVANLQLQNDLHDLTAQISPSFGYRGPSSDDELRAAVMQRAKLYAIDLNPDQVILQRNGYGYGSTVFLAADYNAPVNLPGFAFALHFTPSSTAHDDIQFHVTPGSVRVASRMPRDAKSPANR